MDTEGKKETHMKISTNITRDANDGNPVEVEIKFWEKDKHLQTLTIFIDDPDMFGGTIGIKLGALRKAHEIFPQMQEVITEALKPENDPRAPAKDS